MWKNIYYQNKYDYLNIKNYTIYTFNGGGRKITKDTKATKDTKDKKNKKDKNDKNDKKDKKEKNNLWKYVLENSKASYQAQYDDNGNLYNSVANKGLEINEIATRIGGEYGGFSIKALETIKPILTNRRISNAIKYIEIGDIQKAIGVLRLIDEVYEYGVNIIYSVINLWLKINDIPDNLVPNEFNKNKITITSQKLLNWIYSYNWSPIYGKFEIVDIGYGHDYSIVPPSWLHKIYNNAKELHSDMNKLEWRIGRPPVSFCAIYAMDKVVPEKTLDIGEIRLLNVRIGILIKIENNRINSIIKIFSNKKEYHKWLHSELPQLIKSKNLDNYDYLIFDMNTEELNHKILIVCKFNEISVPSPQYEKKRSVGLLVSTMQKLIRRGPTCSIALKEIMTEIWKSPGYNLPEQQFMRVSANRQLVWRLYIATIEDVQAYSNTTNDEDILSMCDLACLAIIANKYPDVQFTELIFYKIMKTALLIQRVNNKWHIFEESNNNNDGIVLKETNDELLNSLISLYYYMPARNWDELLLNASFKFIRANYDKIIKLESLSDKKIFIDNSIEQNNLGLLAGMDMHPYPNLLIVFQGSLPFLPYDKELHTTRKLWNFIWTCSSAINYREKPIIMDKISKIMLKNLQSIQDYLLYRDAHVINIPEITLNVNSNKIINNKKKNIANDNINDARRKFSERLGFLLLFSDKKTFKYKNKKYDIIIAGDEIDEDGRQQLCKIKTTDSKFLEGDLRKEIEIAFFKTFELEIIPSDAPIGYNWIWANNKKTVTLKTIIDDQHVRFFVDNIEILPFNASNIMIKLIIPLIQDLPEQIGNIVVRALYYDINILKNINDYDINLVMRKLHDKKLPLYDWMPYTTNIPEEIWKSIYIKLFNNKNHEIIIGPVDGTGNALKEPINYLYEGTIWRIINMFSMLYSNTIIITNAIKGLRFQLNSNTAEYLDLIEKIKTLGFKNTTNLNQSITQSKKIKIITKLWPHQENTSNKIIHDIKKYQKRGFGDASEVGAGKTLTALSLLKELYNMNLSSNIYTHKSFLILLPTTYLYKTWQDEIEKHTKGFDMIFQNANGTLTGPLESNSILITTLGRMRDHPLNNSWIFVVIDECLSVQNKNALQTEEAWRQIISSQYGVLLASATFFRTRFDKLFYMLKMLNSGLPENKNYLDAILAETIISNISNKKREWIPTYHPSKLNAKVQNDYNMLIDRDLASDKLYMKLQTFLFDNFDYISAFNNVITKCEKQNKRCLIYTRSKHEADTIAIHIKNVTRFPDLSGVHLAISYVEGTYGLNDLIYLNTIVTRFPEPDKLPQMKGRLDRPNQKDDILYIEYLYIDSTIEKAGMLRLELANKFFNSYIMPLAEFYEIALKIK